MKKVGKDNSQQVLIDAMRKATQIIVPGHEDEEVKLPMRDAKLGMDIFSAHAVNGRNISRIIGAIFMSLP